MKLDHITIRTRNLPATRDFFVELFGLEERARPQALQRIPGHWLYANDKPIVHLIGSGSFRADQAGDGYDHIGFRAEDYKGFRDRLDRMKLKYSLMDLPELNERRIFFHIPSGPLLETVFDDHTTKHKETIS